MGDVEGCFGNGNKVSWRDFCSCVRWCDGSFVRFVRSFVLWFVRPLVRSFDGSFVHASKELHKKTSSGVSAA